MTEADGGDLPSGGNRKAKPAPIPILSLDNASPQASPTDEPNKLSLSPGSTDVPSALLDPNMSPTYQRRSPSPSPKNKRATWYGGGDVSLSFPQAAAATTPLRPPSPIRGTYNPPRSVSPVRGQNPFNFESTTFTPGATTASAPAKRRGHKYKHSSVSINFFQEPPKRNPLPIPASLPIPTLRECYQSMSREQSVRTGWCVLHLAAAGMVYNTHQSLMALSSLAHLLFYDAMGATLCCLVDVLGNFSVWHQSSIRHPFGLERIEVLAGFALAVSLIFMGGDIMSHALQTIIQTLYADADASSLHHHHGNHHESDDGDVSRMVVCVLCGIVVTVVSAVGLENHSRISRTMRHHVNLFPLVDNPSHFLTISFSVAVILLPTVLSPHAVLLDTVLTPLMAFGMCYVGWTLAKVLSGMLVMSHSGPDMTSNIQAELKADPAVSEIWDISFWQVQHQLWLASMKVSMTGSEEDETRVRKSAEDAVRTIMEADYGADQWESTIDVINLSQRK